MKKIISVFLYLFLVLSCGKKPLNVSEESTQYGGQNNVNNKVAITKEEGKKTESKELEEKEKLEQEKREREEREAKEKLEQEKREREEREAKEKLEQEKEAEAEEQRKQKEDQELKAKLEQENREEEAKQKLNQEQAQKEKEAKEKLRKEQDEKEREAKEKLEEEQNNKKEEAKEKVEGEKKEREAKEKLEEDRKKKVEVINTLQKLHSDNEKKFNDKISEFGKLHLPTFAQIKVLDDECAKILKNLTDGINANVRSTDQDIKSSIDSIDILKQKVKNSLKEISDKKLAASPADNKYATVVLAKEIFGTDIKVEDVKSLGKGGFGEVLDLGNGYCVKIFTPQSEFAKNRLDHPINIETAKETQIAWNQANKECKNPKISAVTAVMAEECGKLNYKIEFKDKGVKNFMVFPKVEDFGIIDGKKTMKNLIDFMSLYDDWVDKTNLRHPDLNIDNIIVDKNGNFHLIDLDPMGFTINEKVHFFNSLRHSNCFSYREKKIFRTFLYDKLPESSSDNSTLRAELIDGILGALYRENEIFMECLYRTSMEKEFNDVFLNELLPIAKKEYKRFFGVSDIALNNEENKVLKNARDKAITSMESILKDINKNISELNPTDEDSKYDFDTKLNDIQYSLAEAYFEKGKYEKSAKMFEKLGFDTTSKKSDQLLQKDIYQSWVNACKKEGSLTEEKEKNILSAQVKNFYELDLEYFESYGSNKYKVRDGFLRTGKSAIKNIDRLIELGDIDKTFNEKVNKKINNFGDFIIKYAPSRIDLVAEILKSENFMTLEEKRNFCNNFSEKLCEKGSEGGYKQLDKVYNLFEEEPAIIQMLKDIKTKASLDKDNIKNLDAFISEFEKGLKEAEL